MIDLTKVQKDKFNLISSGCGTGKSYFVMHRLQECYPDIAPEEIIVVTSRSITADQQAREEGMVRYRSSDKDILNFWNDDERGSEIVATLGSGDTRIMTYDAFIGILDHCNDPKHTTLRNAKIVVFDECHTIFCDEFIKNMIAVRMWVYTQVRELHSEKILLGLTATPDIVIQNADRWGVTINPLVDGVLMKHKAKQMICTGVNALPGLIETLDGKTLVMCQSITRCEQLAKRIPHSFVLVSASNDEKFTAEMSWVRDYISKHSKLPDRRFVPAGAIDKLDTDDEVLAEEARYAGHWEPLDVLIATSTIREGFNLTEESGIKNIVSCLSDDIHVVQIAGRARYDLDNLIVVADTMTSSDKSAPDGYVESQHNEFRQFMKGENDGRQWFSKVAHVVQHGFDELKVINPTSDAQGFVRYINDRWATTEDVEEKRLYKEADRKALIEKCVECGVSPKHKCRVTYQHVLKLIQNLGFVVDTKQRRTHSKSVTYKLIRPMATGG